jgi:type III secretory pathway lipoprotein EscJ
VEIIPKTIASTANLIKPVKGSVKVLKADPILEFTPENKKYSYLVKGVVTNVENIQVVSYEEEKEVQQPQQQTTTQTQTTTEIKETSSSNKYIYIGIAVVLLIIMAIVAYLIKTKKIELKKKE